MPVEQTPSPLPPPPANDVLTAEHWAILSAIADTVVPSFTPAEGNRLLQHPLPREVFEASCRGLERGLPVDNGAHDRELSAQFLAENATAQAEFKDGLRRLMNLYLPEEVRKNFMFVLDVLK